MTPEQLRMARNALRLGVRDLAELAGVSFTTVSRFETGKGGLQHSTAEALRKALEAQGIQFLDDKDVARGPGVAVVRPSFLIYVQRRQVTGDPAGDFTSDAQRDDRMPNVSSWPELSDYVYQRGQNRRAVEAARLVWNEYAAQYGLPSGEDDAGEDEE